MVVTRNRVLLVIGLCAFVLVLGTVLSAAEKTAQVAGKWEMSWEGRAGPITATLILEQDSEKLKGTLRSERGGESPVTGTITGKEIRFSVKRETPRGEMTVEYSGTAEGDTIKGTMQMGQFSREWTAKRQK